MFVILYTLFNLSLLEDEWMAISDRDQKFLFGKLKKVYLYARKDSNPQPFDP